jgi:proline iminopeptidase
MKATIRGTEIFFDVAGMQYAPSKKGCEVRPVLFLLHGGPGSNHFRFKQHSLELQEYAQLIFIDHRGCGLSKRTQQKDYTLENNIEDIEALRKYLGLDKICVLGTSYGGMVAQGYAIRYSKHIDKLILSVTAPSFRFLEEAKANLKRSGNAEQIVKASPLWEGNFKSNKQLEAFLAKMDTMYSTVAKKKKAKKKSIPSPFPWSYQALNAGFSGFLKKFDFIPQLHKIKCPTLVLAGKEDWICPPSQSKIIAEHIRDARLKIFNNCGHYVAVDQHVKYINIIKRFLQSK